MGSYQPPDAKALKNALRLLGPLEARIMRQVWTRAIAPRFTVREMQRLLPELAYTTVMTTLNRLAEKGVLDVKPIAGQRAHVYTSTHDVDGFIQWSSRRDADEMIERYGELALAEFADRLGRLPAHDRERLRKLSRR